jgi:hypothetical protein
MKLITISLAVLGALRVYADYTTCGQLYGQPCTNGTCCQFYEGDTWNNALLYCGNGVYENSAAPCPGLIPACSVLPPPYSIAACASGSFTKAVQG